ncbi:MAG: hypothetical protein PHX08_11125 [Lachnospiraceae bacterium]|nr:hypothetical protein [Lachnospiraceae bacterium]
MGWEQVEPLITIPQVLVDILADGTGVSREYKVIENSTQTFADSINEFNGMIGERQIGCPLVVHRRCIEPIEFLKLVSPHLLSSKNNSVRKKKLDNPTFICCKIQHAVI